MGFGVRVLGFRVSGFGFRVQGLGFKVYGVRFICNGHGSRVKGFGLLRGSGSGFRVNVSKFKVEGLRLRLSSSGSLEERNCLAAHRPPRNLPPFLAVVSHTKGLSSRFAKVNSPTNPSTHPLLLLI